MIKRIGVTSGLRGYFAVLYDDDGPIQTGIGSYKTTQEASTEAISWARAEGFTVDSSVLGPIRVKERRDR